MLMSKWTVLNQKILPIGLDIGHSCIKMVQLAHVNGSMKVLSLGRVPVTLSASMDGHQTRRCIVSAIRQLLSHGEFKGRKVVSALSGDKLRITSLRLTETESQQAEKALHREAAQRFDFNPEIDTIDYLLAGSVHDGDEVKNEYIVFGADAETIQAHISLLEEAHLELAGIDAAPCALFRCFERGMRREEDKQRTIIFMDVGQRYTTVVFGRNGEICLAKQMPFGTGRFDEEIASKLEVSIGEAESLRLRAQRNVPMDAAMQQLVTDAIVSAAEQLAKELSLCLRYYTVTFRGKRVERAVVAGGGAREKILLDVLRRHLSIEVEPAEPLRGLDPGTGKQGEESDRSPVDLALAVGLSLKGQQTQASTEEPAEVAPEPVLEGEQA
jgi:type IV pilus assembly protein PilM